MKIKMLAADILSPRKGPKELIEHIANLLNAYLYSKERGFRLYMAVFNLRVKWNMFLLSLHINDEEQDDNEQGV